MIHFANSQSSPGSILLVDDKPDNLRLLSTMLMEHQYEVRRVTKGVMALKTAKAAPPDLIVLDIKLPDLDGYEVCQALKSDPMTAEIPIIFISALDNVLDKVKAFSVGGVDYITKPFQVEEVLVRVKNHLTLRSQHQQLLEKNERLQQEIKARKEIEIALKESQSELQKLNQELQRLAHLDGLTQTANRRQFDHYLQQQWMQLCQEQKTLALIMCDVDYFKSYNDTYGHQAGDDCLRAIAQAISQAIPRTTDLVARYGGEEFAVILPETDLLEAEIIAQTIQKKVQSLKLVHDHSQVSPYITLSLGITCLIPHFQFSPSLLIEWADRALYQAKKQGRNCSVTLLNKTYV
ncbi:Phytochrome-like protein cph2 [Planktothrix tepida]|uniref:Diguanylate cyclase (GGDEF) domain-containing protein n=2 Tax=Planktothrix TaxID=54304 RepID=A0A1J1LGE3_9CYAN|nr:MULTISPECIES: diguanylate cyclase [Planktothrix]CAD5921367.1 Phytochrome-like protein cph2 [Planktothrix tepida]CAD5982936.1 Phytochrome-like protein cph2 [Planktothrix pseudagardhii]CUR30972.1 Diguanylate cyclase (GGDEF) domain-containing protein [Planktothrix tepida PCC 9214]